MFSFYYFFWICILYLLLYVKNIRDQENFKHVLMKSVVHDLKIPMSTIKNYIYILNTAKTNKNIIAKKIDKVLNRGFEIIDDYMLNIKSIDIPKTDVKIDELIKSVLDFDYFSSKNISFSMRIQNVYFIKANEFLLRQVVANIINNATESMSNKKNKEIDIACYTKNDKNYLSIQDNGCGIKKEDIDLIFDPFFSKKTNGNGIGLTFCKHALEKMGFSITCESKADQYTKFTVIF